MAWIGHVTSAKMDVDADFEFFTDGTDAIVVIANSRELINFVLTAHNPGTTDDLEWEILGGHRISNGNGLDGAASGTALDLNTTADGQADDDFYKSYYLIMTTGGERGQGRLITDFVASTDTVTLEATLSGTPSAGETYALYRFDVIQAGSITFAASAPTEDNPHHVSTVIMGYQYIAFRARRSGVTDAIDAWISYDRDGVSV